MIQDAQSIFLSSGCFLDALISGQLDATAWSPSMPSQHALSPPDVEVQLERKDVVMKKQIGLWIDHRETIIVTLGERGEETKRIESDMERYVRSSGKPGSGNSVEENQRDRRFANYLNSYYDEVIAYVREADAILIFGPGEAKGELTARLAKEKLGERIVAVKTEDKMTDPQIAAKVRQHFRQ